LRIALAIGGAVQLGGAVMAWIEGRERRSF
jgi:hypothetical protein